MSEKPIEIFEFKLELSHINKYFTIRSVLNNKFLACKRINSNVYSELGLFDFIENDDSFLFEFELIGQTPKSAKHFIRNTFNDWKKPLVDY